MPSQTRYRSRHCLRLIALGHSDDFAVACLSTEAVLASLVLVQFELASHSPPPIRPSPTGGECAASNVDRYQ